MEKFCKSTTRLPRLRQAGAPQLCSDVAEEDNWPPLKPKQQQTRYRNKSVLKPLKLVSDSNKTSLPSIDQRANKVKVEPWSERHREVDVNKVQPTRRCRFPLIPMTGTQGSVKPPVAEEPVAGTQEPYRNLPQIHMESPYPKPQKRPMTGTSRLKPMKPVPPQYPSISHCIGIVPGPKLEPLNHQPASGSARVFRRFHEVLLEEPPRVERRTSKQRSDFVYRRWQREKGGGLLDEHLETAADSKVPGCSSEALQPEVKRFGLQTGCAGSPARSHWLKKPSKESLVPDDSSEGGSVDSLEDVWDPSTFNVIITYKNTNVLYPKLKDRLD